MGITRLAGRLGALSIGLALACTDPAAPSVSIDTGEKTVRVTVEIADEPEERTLGLMYRTDLAPDEGMLFLFPEERERSFWMKNTPTSLDILYVSTDGEIVGIAEHTKPYSVDPIPSGAPSERVLEVPAGFVERHGVAVGDRITYHAVPESPSR